MMLFKDSTQKLTLRDWQFESIELIREKIRNGHKRIMVCAPTGAGKCLGAGTEVLMFDGRIKKVEDIVAGDVLMGADSSPRNVLSTCSGVEQLYKIIPTKGDPYVVNESHILSLKKTNCVNIKNRSRNRKGEIVNVTVTDYLSKSNNFKHTHKGWRVAVDFENTNDGSKLIQPYLLGLWLGDGSRRNPAVTTGDPEIVDYLESVATTFGHRVRKQKEKGNCETIHIVDKRNGLNFFSSGLDAHGLRKEKHVPHVYKTGTREERMELLAGYLDADGHLSKGYFDAISISKTLADDIVFVARSLGFAAYIKKVNKTCTNNGAVGTYYRFSISGDVGSIPCKIKRRKAAARKQKKDVLVTGIRVEKLDVGKYYGFEIDGDRLFLLGDFTVTHNTVLALNMIEAAREKGSRCMFVCDRITLIEQTSALFDSHSITHGVIQADHWRTNYMLPVQIASAQTLARRAFPDVDFMIVDEAHTVHAAVANKLKLKDTIVIGLSATPLTKGLGRLYDTVVSVTTNNKLVKETILTPHRVYAASEPDMTGAKVVAGEWTDKDASERALKVVGDCVVEYLKHAAGKKFIAFGVDVPHCEAIRNSFIGANISAELYTYKDGDDVKKELMAEFRKPDSNVRGLISVSALSKGLDVPDIECIIIARPLRSSIAEHIQMLGRGLRSSEGKKECIVLDHAGNTMRFYDELNDFFENSISVLCDGKKKQKQKEKKKPKENTKCPKCHHIHAPFPSCPSCGYLYPPKASLMIHEVGDLREIVVGGGNKKMIDELWNQISLYGTKNGWDRKRALAVYLDLTGQKDKEKKDIIFPPYDYRGLDDLVVNKAVVDKIIKNQQAYYFRNKFARRLEA